MKVTRTAARGKKKGGGRDLQRARLVGAEVGPEGGFEKKRKLGSEKALGLALRETEDLFKQDSPLSISR